MIKGMAPLVFAIVVVLVQRIVFPDIILWLPHQMIKF